MSIRVSQFYNKNQFLIKADNSIYLQSYESIVAEWDDIRERLYLGTDWDYSRTTLKHVYLFIEELDVWNDMLQELQEELKRATNKKQLIHKWLKLGKIRINEDL